MPAAPVHPVRPASSPAPGLHAEAGLVFDYTGMLALARRLWSLAEEVWAAMASRTSLAGPAQANFAGGYANQFRDCLGDEQTHATRVAAALRSDADLCAQAWQKAMDEENRRRWAAQVEALKKQRSLVQEAWDHWFGTRFPPEPGGVARPRAPGYIPTAELVRYPAEAAR